MQWIAPAEKDAATATLERRPRDAADHLALVANAACVVLLRKHRHGELHMRAS